VRPGSSKSCLQNAQNYAQSWGAAKNSFIAPENLKLDVELKYQKIAILNLLVEGLGPRLLALGEPCGFRGQAQEAAEHLRLKPTNSLAEQCLNVTRLSGTTL